MIYTSPNRKKSQNERSFKMTEVKRKLFNYWQKSNVRILTKNKMKKFVDYYKLYTLYILF